MAATPAQQARPFDHELADVAVAVRPDRARPVDPLLRRVGLLTITTALIVPIAIATRSDDAPSTLRTAAPASTVFLEAATDPLASAASPATMVVEIALPATDPGVTDAVVETEPTIAATDPTVGTVAPTIATAPTEAFAPATEAPTQAFAPATEAPATVAPTSPPVAAVSSTQAPTTQPPATVAPTQAPTTTLDAAALHDAAVASCTNTYEIRPSEYWILLAKRAGIKLADLLQVNAATVDTPLFAGRPICLPAGVTMPVVTVPATTAAPSTTAKPTATTTTTTIRTKPTTTTQPPVTTPATTVPKATTTTTPAAPPPANTYSRAEVEAIIRDVWPDELEDEAVRIATRESNLVPTVRNACCFGLFQIYYSVHRTWLAQLDITAAAQLYNPQANAIAAYTLYQRSGGWGPWT